MTTRLARTGNHTIPALFEFENNIERHKKSEGICLIRGATLLKALAERKKYNRSGRFFLAHVVSVINVITFVVLVVVNVVVIVAAAVVVVVVVV